MAPTWSSHVPSLKQASSSPPSLLAENDPSALSMTERHKGAAALCPRAVSAGQAEDRGRCRAQGVAYGSLALQDMPA